MTEPKFLIDDFMEHGRPELERIIKVVSEKPKPWMPKAMFLKGFFQEAVKAHIRINQNRKDEEKKKSSPDEVKKALEEKKNKLMEKLNKMRKEKEDMFSNVSSEDFVSDIPVGHEEHEPLNEGGDALPHEVEGLPGVVPPEKPSLGRGPEPLPPEI